ncbi:hypothetical protein RCL1_006081 [Eukaryota sp. TZLM3-RCL]
MLKLLYLHLEFFLFHLQNALLKEQVSHLTTSLDLLPSFFQLFQNSSLFSLINHIPVSSYLSISQLNLVSSSLISLSGIESFCNLSFLYLDTPNLSDLSSLLSFKKDLNISFANIPVTSLFTRNIHNIPYEDTFEFDCDFCHCVKNFCDGLIHTPLNDNQGIDVCSSCFSSFSVFSFVSKFKELHEAHLKNIEKIEFRVANYGSFRMISPNRIESRTDGAFAEISLGTGRPVALALVFSRAMATFFDVFLGFFTEELRFRNGIRFKKNKTVFLHNGQWRTLSVKPFSVRSLVRLILENNSVTLVYQSCTETLPIEEGFVFGIYTTHRGETWSLSPLENYFS